MTEFEIQGGGSTLLTVHPDGRVVISDRLQAGLVEVFRGILERAASDRAIVPPLDDTVAALVTAARTVHRQALGWGMTPRAVEALGAALVAMEGRG